MRLAPQPVARAPSPGSSVQGGVAGGQVMTRVRQDSGSGGVAGAGGQGAGQGGQVQTVQVRQEPLFHSVPPRPQRLLHSEAYIKYIEVSINLNLKFPKEGRCNTIFPRFEGAHCAH